MVNDLTQTERDRARRVFVQLVKPGEATADTRRLTNRTELDPTDWMLVQRLADERLVVTDRDPAGRETAEVVHEALIQSWPRLRSWMEEDREFRVWQERLRDAVRAWKGSGHDSGALLRGVPLTEAERWYTERPHDVSTAEQEFIRTSRNVLERVLGLESLSLARAEDRLPPTSLVAALTNLTHESRLFAEPTQITALAVSRGGLIATALGNRQLQLRNLTSGQTVSSWPVGSVTAVAFTPDGKVLATADGSGSIRLWNVSDGTLRGQPLQDRTNPLYDVAFSPDGKLLAATGQRSLRLWNVAKGKPQATLADSPGPLYDVAFSRSGRLLAAGGLRGVRVWDVASGPAHTLQAGRVGIVNKVAFSADGTLLAAGGQDGRVQLWDVATGHHSGQLPSDQEGAVRAVAFSSHGTLLASAGADTTIRLWDVASRRLLTQWDDRGRGHCVKAGP